ncbi:MAG TPA: L-seryl-tRNA(Sec) selenium transferase [Syntrophorhabdaceae bacterium]|nr:L-seryl-tRNA(Sec) selenium transferase [Syntrophorhabdaceae bacterium]
MPNNLLRQIPKVDSILESAGWASLVSVCPEPIAKDVLREHLDSLRLSIREGRVVAVPSIDEIVTAVGIRAAVLIEPGLKRVINATGIIIHTNLGRSLLASRAVNAIMRVATGYSNLEYDIEKGERGSRYDHCRSVLRTLTGAEDALVVNNNAGAVFLILNTLAEGKEVIISRGELIEIGGSFRIPDVMKKSGAVLREVGTTNRTYIEDFERAIGDNTGLIMKAHTSNYRIRGFAHEASSEELVALGKRYNIPTYYDTGSGLFYNFEDLGASGEPLIPQELKKGFDVISFSGDKLLGAPQAGIVIGEKGCLGAMKQNPMTRALRPDKFTLAGLEATLLLCLDAGSAAGIPTIRMILEEKGAVGKRARRVASQLRKRCPDAGVSVIDVDSEVGGGSFPDMVIPSVGVALESRTMTIAALEAKLRHLPLPVIARIEKERLILDLRTVLAEDEADLVAAVARAFENDR